MSDSGSVPSGNQTWQWKILPKWWFYCETHLEMGDFPLPYRAIPRQTTRFCWLNAPSMNPILGIQPSQTRSPTKGHPRLAMWALIWCIPWKPSGEIILSWGFGRSGLPMSPMSSENPGKSWQIIHLDGYMMWLFLGSHGILEVLQVWMIHVFSSCFFASDLYNSAASSVSTRSPILIPENSQWSPYHVVPAVWINASISGRVCWRGCSTWIIIMHLSWNISWIFHQWYFTRIKIESLCHHIS